MVRETKNDCVCVVNYTIPGIQCLAAIHSEISITYSVNDNKGEKRHRAKDNTVNDGVYREFFVGNGVARRSVHDIRGCKL